MYFATFYNRVKESMLWKNFPEGFLKNKTNEEGKNSKLTC